MINAEFLSQCSDEQINKGVAWCVVSNANISMKLTSEKYSFAASFLRSKSNKTLINYKLYCTSPNDIMPIAFANEVFVIPCLDGGYMASDGVYDTEIEHIIGECNWATNANPLRAICEVYILMSVNK